MGTIAASTQVGGVGVVFLLILALLAGVLCWAGLKLTKRAEVMLARAWGLRQALGIGFLLAAIVLIAGFGLATASNAKHGYLVLLLGLSAGFTVIAIETVVAWRSGRLFRHDPATFKRQRVRKRGLARLLIVLLAVVAIALAGASKSLRALTIGFGVGYFVPLWWVVAVDLALHHDEIKRLTT